MSEKNAKLDNFDFKLLSLLETDASKSITEFAKLINKSKEFCNYRIKRLKELGVIEEIVSVINGKKLGYLTYNFLFELQEVTNEKKLEFENYLMKSIYTKYVRETSGSWDYEVTVMAKDNSELSNFLENIQENFGNYIKSNNFHLRTKTLYYGSFLKSLGKKEFFEKTPKKKIKKKEKKEYTLDEIDFSILDIVSKDATLSIREIALKLDLPFGKVRYSLDNLKENKIITTTNAKINFNYFGYNVYSLSLKIKNFTKEKEKSFKNFLSWNRYSFFSVRIIGNWDVRVQILAKNQLEMKEFISELRDELGESLQYYDFSLALKELKKVSFINR